MGFFYFFPRSGGSGLLDEAGIADRFARAPSATETPAGPQGLPGVVFHDGRTPFVPQGLIWHKACYRPRCDWWLGWHEAARAPGPLELARGVSLSMYGRVRLGDGNDWIVPLLLPCVERDAQRECGLPSIYRLADEAVQDAPRVTADKYQPLLELAGAFLAASLEQRETPAPPALFEFCAALLGVSYRIGAEEILRLELLDSSSAAQMVNLAIDFNERLAAAVARAQAAE